MTFVVQIHRNELLKFAFIMICQEVYIKMEFLKILRENIKYSKYITENYCNT